MTQRNKGSEHRRRGPLRWAQSYRLLEIVARHPEITASELQIEGATIGIEISLRTAFRFLQRYRLSDGDVFKYARTHLQIVADILQGAPPDQLLSASDIRELALERGVSLHVSTVYRILDKLVATGVLIHEDKEPKTFYQWKRESVAHGRIICQSCGRCVEFEKDYLKGLAQNICSSFDYQHDHFELTLHAYCGQCRIQCPP